MALSGPKAFEFDVNINSTIQCTHTVTMFASKHIWILVGGTRVDSASFTFIEGEEFDEQPVTVYGPKVGTFDFKWHVTAPYYINESVLVPKKGDFTVTFDDSDPPDGWYGSNYGFHWGSSSDNWTHKELYYLYTKPPGGPQIDIWIWHPGISLGVRVEHPWGVYNNYPGILQYRIYAGDPPGAYKFYVFSTGEWFASDVITSLGTREFNARHNVDGAIITKTLGARGTIFKSNEYNSYPYNTLFTQPFGQVVARHADPLVFTIDISYSNNYEGAITGGNGDLEASGQWRYYNDNAIYIEVIRLATTPIGSTIRCRSYLFYTTP